MKILKLTLLTLSVCLTTCAFAQYDDYLLKDYFNPNYQRQILDFNISGGLNNTSLKEGIVNGSDFTDRTDLNFNGLFSADYNSITNSIKSQSTTYLGFSLGGDFAKNNDYDSERFNKNAHFNIGLNFRHRGYYYNANKQFLLVQPTATLHYNYNNNKYNTNSSDSKSTVNNFQTLFSIGIGVGLGRIEEVGDARQAIYILQELQKQKLLKKDLSAEQINELAQLITTVKNKRQFDSRIKLIEEITTVDSFFVANDFIDKDHSTAYFTTLYDNWQYANVSRQSGNRFTVGVTPSGEYNGLHAKQSFLNSTIESDREIWNLGADFFASFESEKPINLKWQQSFLAKYTLGTNREIIDDDGQSIHSTTLAASYGLGFYPNSRTEIKGSLSQDVDYLFNEYGSAWVTTTALNFQMSYYFSPQLRLSLSYRAGFNYDQECNKDFDICAYSKNKYPTNVLSFGLSYSLF